jgi:hypothetical protein
VLVEGDTFPSSGALPDQLESLAHLFDFARVYVLASASTDEEENCRRNELLNLLPVGKKDVIPPHVILFIIIASGIMHNITFGRESYFIQLTLEKMQ